MSPNNIDNSEIRISKTGELPSNWLPTTINDIKLIDNLLMLSISYNGGCVKHDFELVGNEMISKSLPPIRSVNLIHKTLEVESCKRLMYDTLYFDLSNLAYQKSTGSIIKLNLTGWKEQIVYTYK